MPVLRARRMVDVSAHLVDPVLPPVQHRQWVLSVPRRVRWHLRHGAGTDGEAVFHPALDLPRADFAAVRAGTVARAAEGRLRRRNSHDVVILAPVRHNRVPLQAATPVDVFVIIITTSELLLTLEELLDRLAQLVTPPRIHKHRTCGVLAPNARLRRAVTASLVTLPCQVT